MNMKFWELTSAFRSETDNLKTVLEKPIWTKYKSNFDNLNSLVKKQDRKTLDEEIPFELAYEVCQLSKIKFWLYYKRQPHQLTNYKQGTDETFEEVSALDILTRFGGSFIEETLERSMSDVTPRKLVNDVEVLGSFNLTNIGMLAILRTENSTLSAKDTLCSHDNLRQWTVVNEALMTVSPFTAQLKMDSQKEQGIRQYIIKPTIGNDKPIPTEILTLKQTDERPNR
jgi:hypothetical protein